MAARAGDAARHTALVLQLAAQRSEIVELLNALDAPIRKVDRMQRGLRQVRAAWPAVLLAVAGLSLLRLLWRRGRSAEVRGLSLVTLAMTAWRLWGLWRRVAAATSRFRTIRRS
ncbi:MAG: hypothetical protein ISP90_12535 [Nevskia sp.]|nr:hypothetical protein [Nevskia sp.]